MLTADWNGVAPRLVIFESLVKAKSEKRKAKSEEQEQEQEQEQALSNEQ